MDDGCSRNVTGSLWHNRPAFLAAAVGLLLAALALAPRAAADDPCGRPHRFAWLWGRSPCPPPEVGGSWYWLQGCEQDRRVIGALFNRYCIRCHGVDGRGVWDIPDVPDFTNSCWQSSRSDGRIAEIIIEGRGAVMPPFRGALSMEEAWGLARHLRTFVPGTQPGMPDYKQPAKEPAKEPAKAPEAAVNGHAPTARFAVGLLGGNVR
jgi:hypothetical protein